MLGNPKKRCPQLALPLHQLVKHGGAKISMFSRFLLLSPSWHQLGSKMTPTWPKTAPRCPNIAPKMPQHGSKMGQHGSKMPQHVLKMPQHTPTWLQPVPLEPSPKCPNCNTYHTFAFFQNQSFHSIISCKIPKNHPQMPQHSPIMTP